MKVASTNNAHAVLNECQTDVVMMNYDGRLHFLCEALTAATFSFRSATFLAKRASYSAFCSFWAWKRRFLRECR